MKINERTKNLLTLLRFVVVNYLAKEYDLIFFIGIPALFDQVIIRRIYIFHLFDLSG